MQGPWVGGITMPILQMEAGSVKEGQKQEGNSRKNRCPRARYPGFNPSSAHTGCVTSGKSLNLSGLCLVTQHHWSPQP